MESNVCSRTLLCIFMCTVLFCHTEAQTQKDDCSVNFKDHYSVSETDPPTTRILTLQAPQSATWSMKVSYSQLPAGVQGTLDPYLVWSRADNNDYKLAVNRVLDLEEINNRLGMPLNTIDVQLTCKQPGRPDQTYNVFVDILPINEYYPHFVGGPFTVNISETENKGYVIMTMDTVSCDHDVRPSTGEIYAYSLVPYDYACFHGKPQDDGRAYFTMTNTQKGTIVLSETLDFERLNHDNTTSMWLNVTITDYALNTNWTTIRIDVLDSDDLSPEFFVKGVCTPMPYKVPPCTIIYKAKILVNTTGIVRDIEPGPIYAYDRDTINNSVTYSMRDSLGFPGIASHLNLDPNSAVLRVTKPFSKGGIYPLYIVAKEVSAYEFPAQTTLDLEAIAPTTTAPAHTSILTKPAGAVTTGPGSNGDGRGKGGRGGSSKDCDDSSEQVAIIGMAVLGALVVGLSIALFISCMKLRHHRLGRVGSGEASPSSSKAFVRQEVLPDGAEGSSPRLEKNRQDPFDSLPEANGRGNKLPPLQPSGSDNADVFDGTRSFNGGLDHEFFKAPGKTKVPLLLSGDTYTANMEPIYIDDGMPE